MRYELLSPSDAEVSAPRTTSHLRRRCVACCLLLACALWWHTPFFAFPNFPAFEPLATCAINWDSTSLILGGERIFLWSGEFHPWRLPVPSLWRDILQKIRAARFNAVSVYTHWGMVNPAEGVFDWHGIRAIRLFLKMAQEEGLYVVLRPGPYINAETSAGGIPGWVTALDTPLRTNGSPWHRAWLPYIKSVIREIKEFQYTRGGPIIAIQLENEHQQRPDSSEYLQQLRATFKEAGIRIPLTINDADPTEEIANGTYAGNFALGKGSQDIFGFDLYPLGFDCSHPERWTSVPTGLDSVHHQLSTGSPLYIPEWQAGAFEGWGPSSSGYDKCNALTGTAFTQTYNLALWSENAKMINLYMAYGGTSWGHLAFPGVYTSYDYGAAISEPRLLTSKYYELKSQGLFLHSAVSFASTSFAGETETGNPNVILRQLAAEDGANFFIARQANVSSEATQLFSFEADTTRGRLRVPPHGHLALNGHQAAVIVTDFVFGRSKLLYSTAPLLWAGSIGKRDVVVMTDALGSRLELQMVNATVEPLVFDEPLDTLQAFTLSSIFSRDQLVLFVKEEVGQKLWNPELSTGRGEGHSVLVLGPYLVRRAILEASGHLRLYGDVDQDTLVEVVAPEYTSRISWNDEVAALGQSPRVPGAFAFWVPGPPEIIRLPQLVQWRYHDGAPERRPEFDDSRWTKANKTDTAAPFEMLMGSDVLFACDYGFCTGSVWYRGRFESGSSDTRVFLVVSGGNGMAASVWMDGRELAVSARTASHDTSEVQIDLPDESAGSQQHVVSVLVDNMGQEMEYDRYTDGIRSPRGIIGYNISGGGPVAWSIQGFTGANDGFPDRVRGIYNEGGTYGERAGWHLPGFDDTAWQARAPAEGISDAGIGVFRCTFRLDLPEGLDTPLQLRFSNESAKYRVDIYMNGWNMGKRVAALGPQTVFPIPEGIIDHHGENVVVLFVWAGGDGGKIHSLTLETAGILRGGLGRIPAANPSWSDKRLESIVPVS